MSHNLDSIRGLYIKDTGVIKGETRSLDYGSYVCMCVSMPLYYTWLKTVSYRLNSLYPH